MKKIGKGNQLKKTYRAANNGCPIFLIIVTFGVYLPRTTHVREIYETIKGAVFAPFIILNINYR